MLKLIFISFFLILAFLSCQNVNTADSFNYERDTPAWLKAKIDTMTTGKLYVRTKVFRYEMNDEYIYYISIPLSSCVYCEVYYQSGKKLNFKDEKVLYDFEHKKKNEILIWERKD